MLPYFQQPALTIGAWRITPFALCAIAALIGGRWMILRRAPRFQIAYDEIAPLYLTVILTGLAGAIGLALLLQTGLSSLGAVIGGIAGGVGYCWAQCVAWARAAALLDVTAFAAPFAGAIGRLGCTLAHDHRGLPSESWLAFHFPEGGRYDLGFIDFLFLVSLSMIFLFLDRKPRPPLLFVGIAGCAYGAFRMCRDNLDATHNYLCWGAVCLFGIASLFSRICTVRLRKTNLHSPQTEPHRLMMRERA